MQAEDPRPVDAGPTESTSRRPVRWQAWLASLRRMAVLGGLGGAAAIFLAVLAPRPWPLCLLTPFIPQWTLLAILLLIVGPRPTLARTVRGRAGLMVFVLALAAVVLSQAVFGRRWAQWNAPVSSHMPTPRLRFLAANVHSSNADHASLLALIALEKPDVILLTEISGDWLRDLDRLRVDYPHRRVLSDDLGNFGMGFWSKVRITDGEFKLFKPADDVGLTDTPQLDATIETEAGRVRVIGLHPLPPVRPGYAAARDAVLAGAGRSIADAPGDVPTVVLGDFNATRYCAGMRDLVEVAGLRDAVPRVKTTWPNTWSWPVMGIRIDHVLVSRHWVINDARVGPDIGSDHWPLIVSASLMPQPATARAGMP